jgi:hypothetical protein
MHPNFGTIIYDMLFEPNDDNTQEKIIQDAIRIVKSDPRGLYLIQVCNFLTKELFYKLKLSIHHECHRYARTAIFETHR